ncbi:hypothetical protein K435DRAFT_795395 [Dendrothele bispora CBS 962.96]|uniref:Uncharacterized protein n=1 Tax=Dendrothele bispora (strain CBS 962.96) TaxID=1314807 RepID=A0A4S8M8W4_DENBC|nr:hypothetical protein K435DRAFT_795395 [Dendrothele bispora CBS 962.96]
MRPHRKLQFVRAFNSARDDVLTGNHLRCSLFAIPFVSSFASFVIFVIQPVVITIDIDIVPYPSQQSTEWKVKQCLSVTIASEESDLGTEGVRVKKLVRDNGVDERNGCKKERCEWGSSMESGWRVLGWRKLELGSAETKEEAELLSEQGHRIKSKVKGMVKSWLRTEDEVEGDDEDEDKNDGYTGSRDEWMGQYPLGVMTEVQGLEQSENNERVDIGFDLSGGKFLGETNDQDLLLGSLRSFFFSLLLVTAFANFINSPFSFAVSFLCQISLMNTTKGHKSPGHQTPAFQAGST